MNRKLIEEHFGPSWVDFMAPFADSEKMDNILKELKAQKTAGKTILPDTKVVFRAFRETPLDTLRVVIVGQDPYPKNGYASGIAFGYDNDQLPMPPSLVKIKEAVEKDAYGGLQLDPPFDHTLLRWAHQGVLMFNSALTVVMDEPASHTEIWAPFTQFVMERLQEVTRNVIFLAWGKPAAEALKPVNAFFHFNPAPAPHPSFAARNKEPWACKHFSTVNAIITSNKLGELIKW